MPVTIQHAVPQLAVPTSSAHAHTHTNVQANTLAPQALVGEKRVFIKSYGCQMNVYDGLRMAELLKPLGYTLQPEVTGADLVVLNTCHIREKADDKMFSDIGRFRRAAAADAIIAVGGCTGQAMGARLMQQAPAVSIVFGPQTYHRLPDFITKVLQGRAERQRGHLNAPIRVTDTDFPELEKFDALPTPGSYGPSAFLTIQEGCDKFCTYCVVPYTRGAEISRPVASVLAEARQLVAQGSKEIVLLGQNVNAYHGENTLGDEVSLADLLRQLAALDGVERLRFTTSHPNNLLPDLIHAFADSPKLMPYFHLPVQAGSNRILQAMNRNHTAEQYLALIEKLYQTRPDLAMSGDFIVGFPGETEEDYAATLQIVHTVGYASAYSFAYSPRPGTPGATLPGQIPEALKKERLAGLQAVIDHCQAAFNQKFHGETVTVLVEEHLPNGQLRGRSPHNIAVNFSTAAPHPRALIGELVPVQVQTAGPKSLVGYHT